MHRIIATILGLALLIGSAASPGQAQIALPGTGAGVDSANTVTLPDPLTPEAVREMVARMSDDEVRGLLLDRLDAVARAEAQPQEAVSLIDRVNDIWVALYSPLLGAVAALPNLISGESTAIAGFVRSFGGAGLLSMFAIIALAVAAGLAVEKLVTLMIRRWQGHQVAADDATLWTSLAFLLRRLIREMAGLVVFFIVVKFVGRSLLSPQQMEFAAPLVTYLIWMPRLGAALGRFVLAPNRADLRLVNIDDHWAGYLYRNIIGLILLSGFTQFIVRFNIAAGLSMADTFIGYWLSALVFVYFGLTAWTARDGLRDMVLGSDPDVTETDRMVADAYPYFAVAVTVAMWMVVQVIAGFGHADILLTSPHMKTMVWLLALPAFDTTIRGLVRHLMPPMIGEGAVAETAYRSTKRSLIRIGRVVGAIIVIMLIADAWNIDLMNLAASGVGERFAASLIESLTTVAVGYIIYELVSLWINRRLAREQTSAGGEEVEAGGDGGGAGGSRLATVLPLVRISAQSAIVVVFALLALSALGIDTTPLLAGAGILGLAIGFGAQKLVTDVVSGIFFLIDDAFRVGEYVEVGGTMGTVEKISIRSMQLRHHRGLVHTIPYGEIPKVTNFSRDWVIMKLMFTVPFDTDPNKVKKIFKKIGAEMIEDPLFKDDFLEPFKSQGVFQFDDVGIVMRGKFMAKPGTQFTIRKEIYNRVRKEFEANGIEFARREVRVAIPGLDGHEGHLSDEEKTAIAAGASGAVQTQIEKEQAEAQAAKG